MKSLKARFAIPSAIFRSLRSMAVAATALVALIVIGPATLAQMPASVATTRILQPVDENTRVSLRGTVHPLAGIANDRGAAPDGMPLDRIQVVLKRSDAQESSLRELINDLHTPGSASYHKWLTPDEFGQQFGPSDQDIATVRAWLEAKGFRIAKVNPGKQTLEMSGNVAQFRNAFHTQIHRYEVNGETHYANANDPEIPAALAPVLGGFASLNNFRLRSYVQKLGEASYDPRTGKTVPQWTIGSASTGYSFALSPGDYAVQYDLNPLYTAGTNGAGQTVAIVNESNIDVYLVNQFRSLFGLPANPPQVIIDGNDPGIDGVNNPDGPNYASVEAYLDVEWAGAVAPNATIDLVIGADTPLENGLILAAERAIYSNVAPVVSLSFGNCEKALGSSNQFFNGLWEQAAAQGISVMVSTGDNGSASCDNPDAQFYAVGGQAVSGLASTPYNVAVGGTDFYYSDWNQSPSLLATQIAGYWNETASNNTPAVSIKGVIPEQPWNSSQYGLNINSVFVDSGDTQTTIAGGSGGASNCATGTYNGSGNTLTCTAGYPKPAWQTGTGVPADKVRDIPDLSLFASSGINASFYVICATDGDCQPVSSGGTVQIFAVGGTSASTPSFAGIMALVNQKYGRQGQADYVLYPLAAQFPAAFRDVTHGTNSVPCNITTVSAGGTTYPAFNCIAVTGPLTVDDPTFGTATEGQIGTGSTAEYNATVGYDLATGLGTVDANVLVNDWNKVTFTTPTVTMSSPKAGTYAHGSSLAFTAAVSGSSPTGNVALMTNSTEPLQQGQDVFPLSSGTASGTITTLPGGTYDVWANYGGDGKNAGGQSSETLITVTPEASGVYLNVFTPNGSGGFTTIASGSTGIPYGTQFQFSTQVAPSSKLAALEACETSSSACPVFGTPTGIVTFADNGTTINTAVLNAEGDAEYNPTDPVAAREVTNVGSHSITASYKGDASYNASTAAATTYAVVKATPSVNVVWPNASIMAGQATTLTLIVESTGVGAPPTGTVTISGAPSGTPTSATLSSSGVDLETGVTESYATIAIPSSAKAGNYGVTFSYGGDTNYTAAAISGTITISAKSGLTPSTTTITTSSSTTSPAALVDVTVTVTGTGTVAPTGTVTLATSAYLFNPLTITPVSGSDRSTVTIQVNSSGILEGANILVAAYSGDGVYAPSSSTATDVANPLSDFSIIPETTIVPVAAGSSGTDTINLYSVNGFAGSVSFTCAGTTVTCSISSSASLSAGSSVPLTLTINAGSSVASGNYDVLVTGTDASGEHVHTLAIEAAVTAAATFALSAIPTTLSVVAASNGTSTISVAPSNGFTGNVTLTCTVTGPSGATSPATCGLNPTSVDATGTTAVTSVLTVTTTATTTAGSYMVKVTGTSGAITSSASVTVTVTAAPPPSFTLSANPISLSVAAGLDGTSTISVTPSNGFTGNVPLACAVTGPSGATSPATCALNPSTVDVTSTTAVTSTLTVSTTTTTTAGTYTVKVTGTSGTITSSASVTVTVTAASTFALSVTLAGTGTGSVSSSPAGISCPSTCSAEFTSGTVVVLTETAAAGSTFAGWSGACSGTGTCSVTMSAAEAVTAMFNSSTGPAVTLTPTSLNFGTVATGVTSPVKTVTLKNSGNAALAITSIAINGANSGDFPETTTCVSPLKAGASCLVKVQFKPSAVGARSAAVSITDNAAGSPQQVPLSGTGTTAKLSPTSVAFGNWAVGLTSTVDKVTLTNVGTTSLTISSIAVTGTEAAYFPQTATTCGASLAAAASCTVSVTFQPSTTGARSANLTFTDGASGSPQQVPLSGTGTTAEITPRTVSFGTLALGLTSAVKTVTLKNVGTSAITITSIAVTGAEAGDFPETATTCGASLGAAASCTVSVTFKPSTTGARSATLTFTDSASGSPQKAPLTGVGTTAELSSTSLNFGSVTVGTTALNTVTLKNVGTAAITITSIMIAGADPGDFGESGCGSSLAAGVSCTISVTFKPTKTGARSATLKITDSAAGSPQQVSLAGTGS